MTTEKIIAANAGRNALRELHLGNKQAARAWALRAIELAPETEDPWLIMAAVAGPRASLQYLKEALRINPESARARAGLSMVRQQLEKSRPAGTQSKAYDSTAGDRQAPEIPERKIPTATPRISLLAGIRFKIPDTLHLPAFLRSSERTTGRSRTSWFGLITFLGVMCLLITAVTIGGSHSRNVKAQGLAASQPRTIILQQMATATATMTPTPQNTPDNPVTPQSINTASPTPSPVPAPKVPEVITAFNSSIPLIPGEANGGKHIIVSISEQHLYAFQENTPVFSFVASTGANNGTRIGSYTILDKIPNAWSDPWGFWMPDWMGIYWAGTTENGIHALPIQTNGNVLWESGLGTPISHGCVVLNTEDARLLYDWTAIGTRVDILK